MSLQSNRAGQFCPKVERGIAGVEVWCVSFVGPVFCFGHFGFFSPFNRMSESFEASLWSGAAEIPAGARGTKDERSSHCGTRFSILSHPSANP